MSNREDDDDQKQDKTQQGVPGQNKPGQGERDSKDNTKPSPSQKPPGSGPSPDRR
jgi:hypothetical protein